MARVQPAGGNEEGGKSELASKVWGLKRAGGDFRRAPTSRGSLQRCEETSHTLGEL